MYIGHTLCPSAIFASKMLGKYTIYARNHSVWRLFPILERKLLFSADPSLDRKPCIFLSCNCEL